MGDVTTEQGRPPVDADLAAAWHRVRADPTIQFDLPVAAPPRIPPWLQWLIDHLGWAGGIGTAMFWILLLAAAIVIVALVVRMVRRIRFRRARPAKIVAPWQPDAGAARALLAEADAMAAAGRYDEAVRLLLHRSVKDVARHRPTLVRPSATTREIGGAAAFPVAARTAFAPIAALVERSLFGGRALVAADWDAARAAYRDFALPGAWA